ncbi:MAG: hypothetical protein KAV87_13400 [Desulfobacteraceae bacterium]|nr:hypothetical protein [Desulfobacteraceae bacterium]
MGDDRLWILPRTHRWNKVVELIATGGSLEQIADASLAAAETGLRHVPADISFTRTLTDIFKFIQAARSKEFERVLMRNGFAVPADRSLFGLISSLKHKIDTDLTEGCARSDLSEIAQNSFTETLTRVTSQETVSLFEATSENVQAALRKQLSGVRFKGFMHEFFTTFTRRYLSYYLSRELPIHVGPGSRFETIKEHDEFGKAFDLYIRQTIRIADEFTPAWFEKAEWKGDLTHKSVSGYAHVAFRKIAGEFRKGTSAGA